VASTPEGRRAIARVAEQVLPALISRLSASELGELEVSEGDWRVRLRRDPATAGVATPNPAAPGERPAGSARGATGEGSSGTERRQNPDRIDRSDRGSAARLAASRRAITSPAVGYFTSRAGLAVGQPIRAGDVVGHVDVLGVPVDVVAPADGRLGRLYAAAGEAVEYGQELVRIDGVEASVTGVGPGTDGAEADAAVANAAGADGAMDIPRPIDLDSTDAETDAGIETAPALLVE
jgi:biotin carboxyl carrier protein